MRDDLAERVEALERKANWLRRWVLVLSAALVSVAVAGASGPKELTLRKLTITDNDGKPRIVADTDSNGDAALNFWDRDGKLRIDAGTKPNGFAGLGIADRDGKVRINAGTESNGLAMLTFADRDGKVRIGASIMLDGASYIGVSDSNGHRTWAETSK
jgi:hypothetical protein